VLDCGPRWTTGQPGFTPKDAYDLIAAMRKHQPDIAIGLYADRAAGMAAFPRDAFQDIDVYLPNGMVEGPVDEEPPGEGEWRPMRDVRVWPTISGSSGIDPATLVELAARHETVDIRYMGLGVDATGIVSTLDSGGEELMLVLDAFDRKRFKGKARAAFMSG